MSRENELRNFRSPEFDGLEPRSIDWARMAAFIDGEGSICINTRQGRQNPGWYLKVTVANTDVRLMVWLKEIFGGSYKDANTEKYYEGKNYKRAYHWSTSAGRAAWILHNCLPYFVIKFEQANIGLQLQDSMKDTRQYKRAGIPPGVVDLRTGLKTRLTALKAKGIQKQEEVGSLIAS